MNPTHSTKFSVPFGDVDMLGHVNSTRYLAYFENARTEHLFSIAGLRRFDEIGLIIAHAEIDYKSAAEFRDELRVDLRTASVGNSSWVYEYEIFNETKKKLVAIGKTVQVAYDYKLDKSIPIPSDFKEKLLQEIASSRE